MNKINIPGVVHNELVFYRLSDITYYGSILFSYLSSPFLRLDQFCAREWWSTGRYIQVGIYVTAVRTIFFAHSLTPLPLLF